MQAETWRTPETRRGQNYSDLQRERMIKQQYAFVYWRGRRDWKEGKENRKMKQGNLIQQTRENLQPGCSFSSGALTYKHDEWMRTIDSYLQPAFCLREGPIDGTLTHLK